MRTLIVVCAVIGVALRALALLPEPASTNAPALVFFEPDWIADNERRLFLAHLRRTLALALETVGLAWLCIGAGHHLLERAGGASSRRRALVVVLASAMVCFLARPVAAVLVGLGGPTDALVAALGTSVDASLERLPWWLIDGAVVVTVLGRWPRAGVLALWAWMSLTNVVGPNVLAVLWPMPAVGTPPPGLVQLVERHGLSSGMLRVVDGDDDAFTHNVGPAREIVLSRGWLARTTPDEQASVVAHEVGHILANDNERDAVIRKHVVACAPGRESGWVGRKIRCGDASCACLTRCCAERTWMALGAADLKRRWLPTERPRVGRGERCIHKPAVDGVGRGAACHRDRRRESELCEPNVLNLHAVSDATRVAARRTRIRSAARRPQATRSYLDMILTWALQCASKRPRPTPSRPARMPARGWRPRSLPRGRHARRARCQNGADHWA